MEFTLEGGQVLTKTHPETVCEGRSCPLHNMSDHSMRSFPQHFRSDRGLMERICSHGVGHPDPDEHDFRASIGDESWDVHGCDGCCFA